MIAGVVVFPEVEELDFVGPWEILAKWSEYALGPERRLIIAQSTTPLTCAQGLSILPHVAFEDCPQLDLLIVPGGMGTRREVDNETIIDFIRRQAQECKAVLAVCTGAFLLQSAGLLEGKRATTHWNSLDRLRCLDGITVVEERFVQDGAIWTSAGVSAGIDMMLAYVCHTLGEDAAAKIQAAAEYYPSRRNYGDFHKQPKAPRYIK